MLLKEKISEITYDGFHFRRAPFVVMVEDLGPDFHGPARYAEPAYGAPPGCAVRHVVGKKGNADILFHESADERGIPDFKKRMDLQRLTGETFLQKPAVTHIFFRQNERFPDDLPDSQIVLLT